jgi:hypothetical protein
MPREEGRATFLGVRLLVTNPVMPQGVPVNVEGQHLALRTRSLMGVQKEGMTATA